MRWDVNERMNSTPGEWQVMDYLELLADNIGR
jgi:hypothetical protein